MNLGMLLGAPSGHLVHIDPDNDWARRLGASYLPGTSLISRRLSVACSGYFYRLADGKSVEEKAYADVGPATALLIEVRADGRQALVPPSFHPGTGEALTWTSADGLPHEPTRLAAGELLRATGRLAAAALLARRWVENYRNELAFFLTGLLVCSGWSEDEVVKFITSIAIVAGDETCRESEIRRTYAKHRDGNLVVGRSALVKIIEPEAVKKLEEWLALEPALDHAPSLVDLGGTDVYNARLYAQRYDKRARYDPGRG